MQTEQHIKKPEQRIYQPVAANLPGAPTSSAMPDLLRDYPILSLHFGLTSEAS